MADEPGQKDIRGIDIDKLAKGFAEEEIILKRFLTSSPTSAREIRWYQKTAGFLETTDTTAMTTNRIGAQSQLLRPEVIRPDWTRNTSYVKKYIVESGTMATEDLRDSDPDILATCIRDLTRAVERAIETNIWAIISEGQTASTINSVSITNEWDDYANATPIIDLLNAKKLIRNYGYNPEGAILLLNPDEHVYLINWLIAQKGSSIPQFASQKIESGVVMEVLGLNVVVSTVVTANYALVFIPQRAATWKSFSPVQARAIEDPGMGTNIRVWEEGVALLTDPRAVTLLDNVGPS